MDINLPEVRFVSFAFGLTDKLVFGGMGIIILNNVGNFSI